MMPSFLQLQKVFNFRCIVGYGFWCVIFSFVAIIGFSKCYAADILVVSDVDDTLKISHVLNWSEALQFSRDDRSGFFGMSELYQAMAAEHTIKIVYLTKAPAFWMRKTHLQFLNHNHLPPGDYVSPATPFANDFKLEQLHRILNNEKPHRVILVGDNGEGDIEVYQTIQREYEQRGIEFYTYVHTLYSSLSERERGKSVQARQLGFVSAADVAIDLWRRGLLSELATKQLLKAVQQALRQELGAVPQTGEDGMDSGLTSSPADSLASDDLKLPPLVDETMAGSTEFSPWLKIFPSFKSCGDYVWQWDQELLDGVFAELLNYRNFVYRRCFGTAHFAAGN